MPRDEPDGPRRRDQSAARAFARALPRVAGHTAPRNAPWWKSLPQSGKRADGSGCAGANLEFGRPVRVARWSSRRRFLEGGRPRRGKAPAQRLIIRRPPRSRHPSRLEHAEARPPARRVMPQAGGGVHFPATPSGRDDVGGDLSAAPEFVAGSQTRPTASPTETERASACPGRRTTGTILLHHLFDSCVGHRIATGSGAGALFKRSRCSSVRRSGSACQRMICLTLPSAPSHVTAALSDRV